MITRAGRGIGAAVALLAAKAYPLCINYRTNAESANRLVAQIRAAAASCPPTSMAAAQALYVTGAILDVSGGR